MGEIPKIKVLDLFSGIGGFSKGLEDTGCFETIAFCEIDEKRWPILKKNWPEVPIIKDVKRIPNGIVVDMVTAGFPCQDISFAGKGAGLSGMRSRLFWRIIRTAGMVGWPRLLLENVAALLDRGLCDVLGAMASVGYDAEWNCIPGSAVGSPHRRDRIWISANHRSKRGEGVFLKEICRQPEFSWCENVGRAEDLPERSDLYPSKLCGGGHGVSQRLDALGNSVIPAIVRIIGEEILATETKSARLKTNRE